MNTKVLLLLGVPLGQSTRLATVFVVKRILSGGHFENPNGISVVGPATNELPR